MDQIKKPRFKLDYVKKMEILEEVVKYEEKWLQKRRRREIFLKSIHIGLAMVCVSAVVLFFVFFDWKPNNTQQTAQSGKTSQETAGGKKSESPPEIYKSDRLAQSRFMPDYERKNDIEVKNGDVTVSAIGGSLREDKEKGVLVVNFYTDKGSLARDHYVTNQNHGALTVYADGAQVRIVAEDGKEWHLTFEGSASGVSYSVN